MDENNNVINFPEAEPAQPAAPPDPAERFRKMRDALAPVMRERKEELFQAIERQDFNAVAKLMNQMAVLESSTKVADYEVRKIEEAQYKARLEADPAFKAKRDAEVATLEKQIMNEHTLETQAETIAELQGQVAALTDIINGTQRKSSFLQKLKGKK